MPRSLNPHRLSPALATGPGERRTSPGRGRLGLALLLVGALLPLGATTPLSAAEEDVPTRGMLTWLRADEAALTVDGDFVTRWDDRGPAGHDATPLADDERPVFDPTAMQGRGAVAFDGENDRLELPFSIQPDDVPTLTVFAAFSSDTADPSPLRKLYGHDDGNFDRTVGIDPRGPADCNYGYFGGPSTGFGDYFGLEANTTYVTTDIYTPTHFRGYVGKQAVVQEPVDNGPGLDTTFIGASGTVFSEFWLGDIAEIIMYDRELSVAERTDVQDYLLARYGGSGEPQPCGVEAPPPDPGEPGTSRIDSADPIDVANEVCGFLVSEGLAEQVVLARDDDFADALAGTQLPHSTCILFTTGGREATLDPRTHAAIGRALGDEGGRVWILGGLNAVSQVVQAQLTGDGRDVVRLSGPTRFETAEAVAEQAREALTGSGVAPTEVIVGFGMNWPDAITVGAWAHAAGSLLVLTGTDELHPAAERVITATNPQRTVIVGGRGVVSDAVAAAVPNPHRVAGANRMATATEVARQLWPSVPATGEDFVFVNLDRADGWTLALASAPLAAAIGGPQLGLRTDSLPTETEQYLVEQNLTEVPSRVFLGDLSFVSDGVVTSVEDVTGG